MLIASATAGSCETGAVLPNKSLAAAAAVARSLADCCTAACSAFIAASISAVKSLALSVAAAAMTSCKCLIAACTAGSADWSDACAVLIACVPAVSAVVRALFAASSAVCKAAVAVSISVSDAVGSLTTACNCLMALATSASCETGAVFVNKSLAASTAAWRPPSAVLTAACNAFIAASISAVKFVALSLAAAAITACKRLMASCTPLSLAAVVFFVASSNF